jgi:phenylpyruvate tautomerase PptA (4-oxalocrotonate tautomerase family)
MPLYTITTQAGVLDSPAKAGLAEKLTAFHAEYAGVPRNWVHIVFYEYPIGNGFTSGRPSPTAALTLLIRTGRSADYKREMLKRLWSLVQAATGAPKLSQVPRPRTGRRRCVVDVIYRCLCISMS